MSLLPGRTLYKDPNVVRPNDMSSVTTHMVTRARPATEVRQRAMQTPRPTKTSTVMIGRYTWSPAGKRSLS